MAKYEEVTIANAEAVTKIGYFEEIICDGDKKEVYVSEEGKLKVQSKLQEFIQPIANAFIALGNTVAEFAKQFANLAVEITKSMKNKKITKKKFIKLLQSKGMQRNEINKIVENNKEPYTYLRYYITIKNRQKIKNDRNNNL